MFNQHGWSQEFEKLIDRLMFGYWNYLQITSDFKNKIGWKCSDWFRNFGLLIYWIKQISPYLTLSISIKFNNILVRFCLPDLRQKWKSIKWLGYINFLV